jgi:hypothetical protein
MSVETRTAERPYYFYTRNFIWISYKDYDVLDGIRYLFVKMATMFYLTLRSGCYRAFVRGLWDGFVGLKQLRPDRTPIKKATVEYLAVLEKGRPSWRARLARHRSQPQI